MKKHIFCLALSFALAPFVPAQVVDGSGTSGRLPLWTSTSTIGNSNLFQTGGKIGLGTTSPSATLNVVGTNGSGLTAPAMTVMNVKGGTGGSFASGGGIQLVAGNGGSFSTAIGGKGSSVMLTGGGGVICLPASVRCGGYENGAGGSIMLLPGSGTPFGKILLAPSGGRVGIGTTSPSVALHVIGNFIATGTKSALVETASYGARQLYAVESAENWFEDFGSAELIHGRAIVKLDPIFAETVNTTDRYHVFLTPKGDCEGLYVSKQTTDGFEVRELRRGTGSISFDYRIVAKRKGYERARLAPADDGVPQPVQSNLARK
jgi:hypothetical protein